MGCREYLRGGGEEEGALAPPPRWEFRKETKKRIRHLTI